MDVKEAGMIHSNMVITCIPFANYRLCNFSLKQTGENRIVFALVMSFFRMDLRFKPPIPLRFVHLREATGPHRLEHSFHRVSCDQSDDLSISHALSRQLSRSDGTHLIIVEEHRIDVQLDSTNTRRQ